MSAGKSTLLTKLKEYECEEFKIILEPLELWENTKDEDGKNILECFYDDQKRFSFLFQINAIFTRYKMLKEIINKAIKYYEKTGRKVVIISERTIISDYYIFASMLYKDKLISYLEYNVYLSWYEEFLNSFILSKTIYIKTSPEICYERLMNRNRSGEETISLSYLRKIHDKHEFFYEDFLSKVNCLVLDGNVDRNDEKYQCLIQNILDHCK